MEAGILTYAKRFAERFLTKGWSTGVADVSVAGIPIGGVSYSGDVIHTGDYDSQIKANKGIVFACVDLRAISVAQTVLRIYVTRSGKEKSNYKWTLTKEVPKKKKDWIFEKAIPGSQVSMAADLEEVVNGPLVDLLRNVNGYMNRFDLLKLTVYGEDLTGNCYWALQRNKLGVPIAIWIVPSQFMSPIPESNTFIKGYKYKRGQKEITFPPEDIIHFKVASLLSPYIGEASINPAVESINLRQHMLNFEQDMFRMNGNTGGYIFTKTDPGPEKAKAIKSKADAARRKRGHVVMSDVYTLVEPKTLTARDMGYREGLAMTRDEISAVLHVPKAIITPEGINFANSKSAEWSIAKYATSPICVQIDEKVTEQLCPQFADNLVAIFDNPVKEDAEERRENIKMMVELGIIDRNEARHLVEGLEPKEGGDGLLVPASLTPIEQVGQQQETPVEEMVRQAEDVMAIMKARRSG